MVMSQLLSLNKCLLRVRDEDKVKASAIADHFLYKERSEQYEQHAVAHYPAKT